MMFTTCDDCRRSTAGSCPLHPRTFTVPRMEPLSDVNVGGPDAPAPGEPPELTVGTVVVPYYGDEARRLLWGQLDYVRRKHMEAHEPVTITVPREFATQAVNALRARGRHRAHAAFKEALDAL